MSTLSSNESQSTHSTLTSSNPLSSDSLHSAATSLPSNALSMTSLMHLSWSQRFTTLLCKFTNGFEFSDVDGAERTACFLKENKNENGCYRYAIIMVFNSNSPN